MAALEGSDGAALIEGSGAEILAESLLASGVDTVFGVPGDTGVGFYDALHGRPGLRHVLTNDERGAAFAADAYARRRNRLGVVEVSSGGGATFAVGGLGEAYAASVPLLVLSSDIQRRSHGTGALTETDQVALFQGVTKWQAMASDAAEIPALLEASMTLALSGRPGPVALIVPEDVLEERARTPVRRIDGSLAAARPQAPERDLVDVARAIDRARRPALVAGGGVHLSDAHAQLARLAERAGIAVATTLHGKGAIGERSPLWLGTAGANGGRPYANRYLAEADLVLFVGTRANATDTDGFRSPPRQGCVVGHIDIDPARAGHNYPGSRALCGDARTVLARLADLVSPAPERTEAIIRWIAGERAAWDKALASRRPPDGVLDPAAIVEVLRTVLPDGTTVVADCGTPTPYLGAGWFMEQAGRRLLLPRGHGPMGYAYPAAVGAAFAVPGEPVLAITTDGSLLMAAGAMETAARLALPITYVQMTNGSLGWIKALQHLYFEGRSYSTGISRFDTVAVARGLGLNARRATSLEELCEAAEASLAAGRPALIDVPVPDEHVLLPPVAPWERAASTFGSDRPVY